MSATAQPALSSPKLILIVDDTPVNLGVISGALKDFYKTKVATNGERALALASADEKPDLILLDVMMPGMDGYEVCSRLKADPTTCEIPVIFLTGQTSVEDETRGFEVGGVDYVHKPFSRRSLKPASAAISSSGKPAPNWPSNSTPSTTNSNWLARFSFRSFLTLCPNSQASTSLPVSFR